MYLSEATSTPDSQKMKIFHGRGNKCGGSVGRLTVLGEQINDSFICNDYSHPYENEQERYAAAHSKSCDELRRIYGELRGECDSAWVFLMHITLLSDPLFCELARLYISEGKSAENAVIMCRKYFFDVLLSSEGGENLKDVSIDVCDVSNRLLSCLAEKNDKNTFFRSADNSCVLACKFPFPSLIVALRNNIVGIAVSEGGSFPSAKELASDFGIPFVSFDGEIDERYSQKTAIIDSDKGYLYVDPDLITLAGFSDVEEKKRLEEKKQNELAARSAVTKDGRHLLLLCEVSGTSDLDSALIKGCDGIGKLSSEELYLESVSFPDEELLFERYREVAEAMPAKPIMIRSFKTSGAVRVRSMISEREHGHQNERELYVIYDSALKTQLRAVMRAAVYGALHFVLPKSGDYSELSSCAQIMEELFEELYEEDREYSPVPLGLVIDSVSAAIMCERLIADCDFFIVDKEKLSASVFAQADGDGSEEGEYEHTVRADAFERLISYVFETVKKAKKKVVISLGKNASRSEVIAAIDHGFEIISVDSSCVARVKKIISDTQLSKKQDDEQYG